MKNQGLSNPAIIAAATAPAVQEASSKAINLGFTILKYTIFGVVGYVLYQRVVNGFDKQKENPDYKPSNISQANAQRRADNLFRAMYGVGANHKKVIEALMITKTQPINYNGFVRVFNSFGNRKGADFEKMNLTQWLYNQFDAMDIAKIKIATKLNF